VKLAPGFEACSDAKDGPLKPGEVGTVRTDDGSSKPFHVEAADGRKWWYDVGALELAEAPKVIIFCSVLTF
jgi:hypothetical protein